MTPLIQTALCTSYSTMLVHDKGKAVVVSMHFLVSTQSNHINWQQKTYISKCNSTAELGPL